MEDIEKVLNGLELCTNISPDGCLMLCPYKDENDETYSGFCEQVLKQDALALLKEQEAMNVDVFVQWCIDSHIMGDATVRGIKYWVGKYKEIKECR